MYIYKITSPSGKIYIGQTINFKKRMQKYKSLHCKKQSKIYNSLLKYGFENHKVEILFYQNNLDIDLLNQKEKEFYDLYKQSNEMLNLKECGGAKVKFSEEARKNMSIAQLGKKQPKSQIEKRKTTILNNGGVWNKNKKLSIEQIEKLKKPRVNKQGQLHHNSKLTEQDVLFIIKLLKNNKSQNSIALLFNVSRSTIKNIKENRNWKYLKR